MMTMLKYFVISLLTISGTLGAPQPQIKNTPPIFKSRSCGQFHPDAVQSRIANNTNERYSDDFPWNAKIFKLTSFLSLSGSIIHPRVILTAAHNLTGENPSDFRVRVGEWANRTTILPSQDRNVSEIIIHENYTGSGLLNDFALLVLSEPVTLGDNVNIICLPNQNTIFDESRCFARVLEDSGKEYKLPDTFIRSEPNSSRSSLSHRRELGVRDIPTLMISRNIISHNVCEELLQETRLGRNFHLPSSSICIFDDVSEECSQGVRGSPLICPFSNEPGRYVQVGAFSEIEACPVNDSSWGLPKVYGSILSVLPWIDRKMENYGFEVPYYTDTAEKKKPDPAINCGWSHVVGLESASSGEQYSGVFPWNAKVIGLKSVLSVSGSLIHPQVILTAARPIRGKKPSELIIRVGEWSNPKNILPSQERNVYNISIHENYVNNGLVDDFALLILSDPVTLTDNVNTICLPNPNTVFDASLCFARILEEDRFENNHQMISTQIIDYDDCRGSLRSTRLGGTFDLPSSSICILDGTGNTFCDGVQGSPLVCPILGEQNRYVQVGALSEIDACLVNSQLKRNSSVPKIYRNITSARLWIDQQMKNYGFSILSYTDPAEEKRIDIKRRKFNASACGRSHSDNLGSGSSDSNKTYSNEFPWMVRILRNDYREGYVYECGGSLIHPQIILTAVNCLKFVRSQPELFKVRAGEWDTRTSNHIQRHQDRSIAEIIFHENYNDTIEDQTGFNDVALLVLTEPFTIADNVNTVCLPKKYAFFHRIQCFVFGWGEDLSGEGILRSHELKYVNYNTCRKTLHGINMERYLDKSLICADGAATKFICHNSLGSPLVCPVPEDPTRYVQVGIFSSNLACGQSGIPNLYANIVGAKSWIEKELENIFDSTNIERLID